MHQGALPMSRVFEALNKASNEKKRDGQTAPTSTEMNVTAYAPAPEKELDLRELTVSRNVKDHSVSPSLQIGNNGTKNCPDNVEELFFGWDIRLYRSQHFVTTEVETPPSVPDKTIS